MASSSSNSNQNLDDRFKEKMEEILGAIGITDNSMKTEILDGFSTFTDEAKYALLADNELNKAVTNLVAADKTLHELIDSGPLKTYFNKIQTQWNNMTKNLAELQGLIILKKVNKKDCDEVINKLLAAVNGKLSVVNGILKGELNQAGGRKLYQAGGGNDELMYKSKYLKYKTKYLNLMQNKKL